MQDDDDDPESPPFLPHFPVSIPFRAADGAMLVLNLSDSTGTEMFKCVPVFTDKQRCIVFGASCGFSQPLVIGTANQLAECLMEAKTTLGADTASLDPLSPDEVRGVRAIEYAIQSLWRLADPEEFCEE